MDVISHQTCLQAAGLNLKRQESGGTEGGKLLWMVQRGGTRGRGLR